MRKYKYVLSALELLLFLFSFWFFLLKDVRENRLMKEGNKIVEKVEAFKEEHNRLPNSLVEIRLEEMDGSDVLYYDKRDHLNYIVSFETALLSSMSNTT